MIQELLDAKTALEVAQNSDLIVNIDARIETIKKELERLKSDKENYLAPFDRAVLEAAKLQQVTLTQWIEKGHSYSMYLADKPMEWYNHKVWLREALFNEYGWRWYCCINIPNVVVKEFRMDTITNSTDIEDIKAAAKQLVANSGYRWASE